MVIFGRMDLQIIFICWLKVIALEAIYLYIKNINYKISPLCVEYGVGTVGETL